jgi:hypothetical protein
MVWKSNLSEDDVEFIDDFGTKTKNSMATGAMAGHKPAVDASDMRSVAQT